MCDNNYVYNVLIQIIREISRKVSQIQNRKYYHSKCMHAVYSFYYLHSWPRRVPYSWPQWWDQQADTREEPLAGAYQGAGWTRLLCEREIFVCKNFNFFVAVLCNWQKVGPRMLDHEGKELPGNRGYKWEITISIIASVVCIFLTCVRLCLCSGILEQRETCLVWGNFLSSDVSVPFLNHFHYTTYMYTHSYLVMYCQGIIQRGRRRDILLPPYKICIQLLVVYELSRQGNPKTHQNSPTCKTT